MNHRGLKDPLYTQFARIGHALASPRRIELLDLLAQGAKTVEALAGETDTPVKNTSAHLRVLRQALLVDTRRDGTFIHYRLADESVVPLIRALQTVAHRRFAEVEKVASIYLSGKDKLAPVSVAELRRLLRDDDITLIDVRPAAEYEAGHIPGAVSIPVGQLGRRWREVPKRREAIAYCRGPYCVYSVEALGLLRKHGIRARRLAEGFPDWRAEGLPVADGAR